MAVPNARWSVYFVHNQFVTARRQRILNVVDYVTKAFRSPQDERLGSIHDAPLMVTALWTDAGFVCGTVRGNFTRISQ